jgi:Tfp pilus assembly protein PilZ
MPQRIQWMEAEETVASNRRIQTRHVVAMPITLTIDGTPNSCSCTMLNLSLGGAQVVANTKFSMGQRVQISFHVPTMAEAIEVGGTIRWSNAEGIGVQFDGLRARDVWALNEYFKQLPS